MRILVTSREGLAVADEQVWPVRSLDIDAAADLFVERAQQRGAAFRPGHASGRGDLPTARWNSAGDRIGGLAHGVDDRDEIRDRLDHRFKLLVGSRRALGRHQTLRHAVAWSYDLLDDAERALLDRCSVFAGGFDLESACAVAGSLRPIATSTRIMLDALVRKSLIVADQSSGRTRFSMLETIREFAEEQLVGAMAPRGGPRRARHYFADREADIMALWDGPRQREAYTWFEAELANLRSRVSVGRRPRLSRLTAVAIAMYRRARRNPRELRADLLGGGADRSLPRPRTIPAVWPCTSWPRICWLRAGRIDGGCRLRRGWPGDSERRKGDEVPFGVEGLLGGPT